MKNTISISKKTDLIDFNFKCLTLQIKVSSCKIYLMQLILFTMVINFQNPDSYL